VSLRRRWRSCEEFVDLGGDLVEGVEVGDLRLQTLGRAGVGGVAQHSTDRVTDRLVGGVAGAQVDPGPGPRDMGGDLGFVLGVPGHHQWQSVRQRLQDPAVTAVGHQDVGVRQQQVERHEPTDPGVGRHAPERGVLAAGGHHHQGVGVGQPSRRRREQGVGVQVGHRALGDHHHRRGPARRPATTRAVRRRASAARPGWGRRTAVRAGRQSGGTRTRPGTTGGDGRAPWPDRRRTGGSARSRPTGPQPPAGGFRPGPGVTDRQPRQVGEHLAALLVQAERPGRAGEAHRLEMA